MRTYERGGPQEAFSEPVLAAPREGEASHEGTEEWHGEVACEPENGLDFLLYIHMLLQAAEVNQYTHIHHTHTHTHLPQAKLKHASS